MSPTPPGLWWATPSLSLLLLLLAMATAQDMTIVSSNGDPDRELDDAGTIKMIFTTNLKFQLCQWTTPDNLELEPLFCDVADVLNTCLAEYTLPDARPTVWKYKYAIGTSLDTDCGIHLTRVTLKDTGNWTVNICADAEKKNCVTGWVNLAVKANEIESSSLSSSDNADPGSMVSAVFRTRLPHDNCRFISPDGYTLHVVNGKLDEYGKHPDDTIRPDNWKYQWFGWNDTARDCGIRLRWLHPQDEGLWTVRMGNVGEPSVDMTETFMVHVTDFELQVEPLEAKGDEGQTLIARYRATYPYQTCTFITPEGHALEAVRCKPEEDIEPCITKYNASWPDPARPPGLWTYQYQYWNNSNLDCGIQINSPVPADTGVWNFSISSIAGEAIHRTIHMHVQVNELLAEDYDPVVEKGATATMVFRTRLPYDTCSFTTPQGNTIDLVAGLPTIYNKTWEDAGERPAGEWTFSWHAWNSTDRDCGIKIHRVVAADKGEWKVRIGKRTGTTLSASFNIDVMEPTTPVTGGTTTVGTGTTTAEPGTTTGGSGTTTGGSGTTTSGTGTTVEEGGTTTAAEPSKAGGLAVSVFLWLSMLLLTKITY